MTIDKIIEELLTKEFSPTSLTVRNDSHLHQGHAGSPGTGESHFTVTIVSNVFENKSRVQRHQMIYSCLQELMNNPIHALAIHASSPKEQK